MSARPEVAPAEIIGLGPAQWPLFVRDGADLGSGRTVLRISGTGWTAEAVRRVLTGIEAAQLDVGPVPGLGVPAMVLPEAQDVSPSGIAGRAVSVPADDVVSLSLLSACFDLASTALLWRVLRHQLDGADVAPFVEEFSFCDVLEWQNENAERAVPGSVAGAFRSLLAAAPPAGPAPRHEWFELRAAAVDGALVRPAHLIDHVALALRSCLGELPAESLPVLGLLSGRHVPELADVIGSLDLFAPLEVRVQGLSVEQAETELSRVRAEAAAAYSADPVGTAQVCVEELRRRRSSGELLVGAVLFPEFDDPRVELVDVDPGPADAVAFVDPATGRIRVGVDTTRIAVDPAILAERLTRRLAAFQDGSVRVDAPPGVGPVEAGAQRALLWHPADAPLSLVEQIWRAGDRDPEATALVDESGAVLTYRDLRARALAAAGALRAGRSARGELVAVRAQETVDVVVGMLAGMVSGVTVVPVADHTRRTVDALRAGGVRLGLCFSADGAAGMEALGLAPLRGDRTSHDGSTSHDPDQMSGQELAYVIATSGTSGQPRLVGVTHDGLAAYATGAAEYLEICAATVALSPAALVNDLALTAVWPVLAAGGTVVAVPPEARTSPLEFAALVVRSKATLVKLTPSHLSVLLDDDAACLPIRTLVVGGEALPAALLARVRALRPDLTVVNHYGPTETTIGVVAGVPSAQSASQVPPLGTVLPGVTAVVVGVDEEPVPFGFRGELVVGGPGVARGYLGDPRTTALRFVPVASGGRAFRTGDVVTASADGTLTFCGRVDRQAKVRGWRVEPGEVEAALRALPGVRQAVVTVDDEGLLMTAFVVTDDDARGEDLTQLLVPVLPPAMIPARVVIVDRIPLTPSGKLDRDLLDAAAVRQPEVAVAPRTDVERALAEMWSELVGHSEIDVTVSVFALGAHSLTAMQAASRLRQLFQVEVAVAAIFDHPTIAAFARYMDDLPDAGRIRRRAAIIAQVAALPNDEIAALSADGGTP